MDKTIITPEIWNLLVQAHNYGILHAMDRVSSGEISHTFAEFQSAYNLEVDWNK